MVIVHSSTFIMCLQYNIQFMQNKKNSPLLTGEKKCFNLRVLVNVGSPVPWKSTICFISTHRVLYVILERFCVGRASLLWYTIKVQSRQAVIYLPAIIHLSLWSCRSCQCRILSSDISCLTRQQYALICDISTSGVDIISWQVDHFIGAFACGN